MPLRPKTEAENLEACPHGGFDYAELRAMGLSPDEVLDFSVSSNPFPPPPGLEKIIDTANIQRYPDSEATEFRQCLSSRLGVSPRNILAGNGAVELIRLIALTYFRHSDTILILEPTFGEYKVASQIVGAGVISQRAGEEASFVLKIEETVDLIQRYHPRGVFVCNPNSPTGQYLTRGEVEAVLDTNRDGLLILDEAYVAFVEESWSSIDLIGRGDVVIVRSMTKDYGLAGLRLGYAVASEEIITVLNRVRPPWNVNAVAQRAGVIVLKATDCLERCQRETMKARQFLMGALRQIGFTLIPSNTNFFLVKVGNAKNFRTALLRRGMLVRDCTSFGLPGYVRISARTLPECQKLITTIQAIVSEGKLDAITCKEKK